MAKLTNLELYGNELSGNLLKNIGKLSKLKHLILHINSLIGSLPLSLVKCTNLTTLILWFNFVEGNISTFKFSALHQLTVVDLGINKFFVNLPTSLFSCKSLKAVLLSKNRLMGHIQQEVVHLKFISFLSLVDNRLTNITNAIKILMRCKPLTTVLVGGNFLHEAIPSDHNVFGSNGFENVQVLSLPGCQLTGQLPTWISKLKKLEYLTLSENRITGSIPSWLSTLPRLFALDLADNLILGEFLNELCALPALVSPKAPIAHNHLDLPIFLSTRSFTQYNFLSNLYPSIYVGSNNLSGNIPIEIGHLKQLHALDLSCNNFLGNIPNKLSELTNLEELDLFENRLSSKMPESPSSLHFFHDFSVANNNLHGPIPFGTQLQSFDASTYEGNPGLCGPPLPHECAHIGTNN